MTDMSAEIPVIELEERTASEASERQERPEQQLIFCRMIRSLKRRSSGRRR